MIVWGRQRRKYQQTGLGPSQAVFFNDLGSGGTPPPLPQVVTTQVGGSGKDRSNQIVEVNGLRFSVPKDRVEEFLARFQPKTKEQEVTAKPYFEIPQTVTFSTPSGLTVTTDRQVLKDDIGVVLVMAALADEDFYED